MKTNKILSLILYLPLSLLLHSTAQSQGINISSGGNITATGAASLLINNGGFVNNGTYTKGTETVTFSGSTANIITGNNTDMYNLSVTNTGGITTQVDLLTTTNLTVESGSKLIIDPVKAVIVSNTLTNNAGTDGLVIKSGVSGTASLIHNTNDVPATVERFIIGDAEAWHFLSSPVSAQGISGSWLPSGTYANGTGYDLYLWNEANSCWIYKLDITSAINWNTVHPGTDFVPGRGYLYSVQATNPTKEFAGNLNNGTISYELVFAGDNVSLKGFNLAGNPYPSSIDWAATSGWTRTPLMSSGGGYDMWIWNPAASNYGVYNSADVDGVGTNSVTQYIAPMQGYFVQAASAGNLSLNNDVRAIDVAGNWLKSAKHDVNKVSLRVKSDEGYGSDEVQLRFGYSETENGAMKLFSRVVTAPGLYMASEGKNLSVHYFTDTQENPVVPLMFTPGMNGGYTITCNFDRDKYETLMLEDRQSHYIHNLKGSKTYSFTASKTDNANRFVLHFMPFMNLSEKNELPGRIYTDGIQLIIDLTLVSKETDVFVYDLLGRLLLQKKFQGEIQHKLNINTNSQILIVHLNNPDGNLSLKLVWGGN